MHDPWMDHAYVVGPGERGQDLVFPVAAFTALDDAEQFVKAHWNLAGHIEPYTVPNMWFIRREEHNPVDMIFVYRIPLGVQE